MALAGIECEPAGEYVRLAYSRQRSLEEGTEGLRRACGYYDDGGNKGPDGACMGTDERVDECRLANLSLFCPV